MTALTRWLRGALGQRSLKRNVALSWGVSLVSAVVSLGITPLVVRSLDTELYGVWTFLNGLTLYGNLLYFGLGAAFMKRMSEASGRRDAAEESRLLGVALTTYAGLGVFCLVMAAAVSPIVPALLATPLAPEASRAASVTLVLLGVRLLFMFVNSALTALLASEGRFDLVSGVLILVSVLRALVTIEVTRSPAPLVGLAVLMVLDAVVQLPLLLLCCRAIAPAVRFRPVVPSRAELGALYGFGAMAFLVQMGELVIVYTDTALIGVILGAASVSMYALPLQLIEYSRVVVSGITQSLLPEIAALRSRGDTAGMRRLYFQAARMSATMAFFINVHLVMLGPAFLAVWVGPEIADGSFPILVCLAIAATASAASLQVLVPYYQALDQVRVLAVIVVVEAVANFALSIWLATRLGVWGVALATALPAVAVSLLLAPRRVLALLGIGLPQVVRQVVLPALAVGAAGAVVQVALGPWLPVTSYGTLAVRAMASCVIAGLAVPLAFPRDGWLPMVARVAPRLAQRLG